MKVQEMLELLERSYCFHPCEFCEPLSKGIYKSDMRCPECGDSPKQRIQTQRRLETK